MGRKPEKLTIIVLDEATSHNWLSDAEPNAMQVSCPHNEQFFHIMSQSPNQILGIFNYLIYTPMILL